MTGVFRMSGISSETTIQTVEGKDSIQVVLLVLGNVVTDRGVFVCSSGVIVYLIDTCDFLHVVRRNPGIRELCLLRDVCHSFYIVGCEGGPVPMAIRGCELCWAVSNRSKYRLPDRFTHPVMQLQLVEYLGVVSYQCYFS